MDGPVVRTGHHFTDYTYTTLANPRAAVNRSAAIFDIVRSFDLTLLTQQIHDDVSSGSRVCRVDEQTDTHT